MSPRQEQVLNAMIGGIVTVLLTAVLAFVTGAWSAKETRADHLADVQLLRSEQQSANAETRALIQRLLDGWCEKNPQTRVCN